MVMEDEMFLKKFVIASLSATILFAMDINKAEAQDNCVALAGVIGLNYSRSLSVDQQRSINMAGMCSEKFSSASEAKQGRIKASYKLFSGSTSASRAEVTQSQENHCENKFGDYWYNEITDTESRTFSNEAASVLDTCLKMGQDFLFPSLEVANGGQEVTMSIQYKPNVNSELKIAMFGPMDLQSNTCIITKNGTSTPMTEPSDVSQTLKPTESVTISCTRTSTSTLIDNVTHDCTNETIFHISTSGPVKAIKIPRVCSEKIGRSRADQIESDVKELSNRLARADVIEQPGNVVQCNTGWATGISTASCPRNTLRVGGGCQFSCNELDHTVSRPMDEQDWRCRAVSHDTQNRTFRAWATCLRLN